MRGREGAFLGGGRGGPGGQLGSPWLSQPPESPGLCFLGAGPAPQPPARPLRPSSPEPQPRFSHPLPSAPPPSSSGLPRPRNSSELRGPCGDPLLSGLPFSPVSLAGRGQDPQNWLPNSQVLGCLLIIAFRIRRLARKQTAQHPARARRPAQQCPVQSALAPPSGPFPGCSLALRPRPEACALSARGASGTLSFGACTEEGQTLGSAPF